MSNGSTSDLLKENWFVALMVQVYLNLTPKTLWPHDCYLSGALCTPYLSLLSKCKWRLKRIPRCAQQVFF